MRRREFLGILGNAAAAWPFRARAQQAEKLARVGFLGPQARTNLGMAEYYREFSSQLEKNGFREGQNIIVEYRGIDDPLGPFVAAAELVRSQRWWPFFFSPIWASCCGVVLAAGRYTRPLVSLSPYGYEP